MIPVGALIKPHGLKGAIKVHLFNPSSNVLQKNLEIFLSNAKLFDLEQVVELDHLPASFLPLKIKKFDLGNHPTIIFQDLEDINLIEKYLGSIIWLNYEKFPALKEGEFYWCDLIGMEAFDAHHFDKIGKVTGHFFNGAQDIMVITLDKGGELNLPFLPVFISKVDLSKRSIYIISPDFI